MIDFEEERSFGDLLARYRTQTRTSQQKLAGCLGVTRTTVVKWEQKGSLPKDRTRIEEIVRCLQLTDHQRETLLRSALFDISHNIWNVPFLRNPHFTGRDELLDQLTKQLSPAGQDDPTITRRAALTQPKAIKGLGGIGKTQIAVEYAYRSQEQGRYIHTFWINAASEEALITSFTDLAQLLPSFSTKDEKDQKKLVAAVKRWLEQCQQHWLLTVDNVEDISLVHEYLPQRGNGSIVLTTRMNAVGSLATSIEVETLGVIEGTELLLRRAQRFEHASDEEINEASNIVVALDHFPLALDQAGAYIEETHCSFADYLLLYQAHRQKLLARRGIQATEYPDSVATTWLLSFQKVEQANPAATELLQLCAFLAPDRIPEELIEDGAAHWPLRLQQAVKDRFTFNEMIEALLAFSLVKRLVEDRMLGIHRLVQAVQIDTIEPKEQRQWAERVVLVMNAVFPSDAQEVNTWSQCLRYLEQAQACDALIQQHQLVLIEAADLLNRAGRYTYEHGLYTLAEPLFQHAQGIWEQQLGAEHSDVATVLNNLAALYREQGKYAEAESLFKQALHIREQQLGTEHPDVATVLNGLALFYQRQGKYAEAESLFKRALYIREKQLGAEHSDVATVLNNLADLYREQGKYAEAESLFKRALYIREKQLGAEHLKIAHPLNNLAIVYQEQGKYAEAEPLFKQAIRIAEQQLGAEHHNLSYPLNNLADLYREQGKYAEAESLFKRALYITEKQLGAEHSDVAYPLSGLADLYREQGKYAEAEPLYQRALRIWEASLGPDHPEVAYPLSGLADLYREQGKYAEAESLYQRALRIREQQLGTEHSLVAHPLNGMAELYRKQGKYAEAESLYRRALSLREHSLGSRHPDTAETLHGFATLRVAQGNLQEAEALYQHALAIREHVFGSLHPKTCETGKHLRDVLMRMGKVEEAAQLDEMQPESVEMKEKEVLHRGERSDSENDAPQ